MYGKFLYVIKFLICIICGVRRSSQGIDPYLRQPFYILTSLSLFPSLSLPLLPSLSLSLFFSHCPSLSPLLSLIFGFSVWLLGVLPLSISPSASHPWHLVLIVFSVSQKCTNQRLEYQLAFGVPISVPWYIPIFPPRFDPMAAKPLSNCPQIDALKLRT